MAKLFLNSPGIALREIELKPGPNRIGRKPENDFQITDGSISGSHCELYLTEGHVYVRDLGSTNGTFIDGQQITEAYIMPNQILKLGNIEIRYPDPAAPPVEAPAAKPGLRVSKVEATPFAPATAAGAETAAAGASKPGLRVSKIEHAPATATAASPVQYDPRRVYVAPVYDDRTFFQRLPTVFGYPFKGNGTVIIICATFFFALLEWMKNQPFYMVMRAFGMGIAINVIFYGFVAAIMQRIVTHSAQGDEDMPGFPELSYDELGHPSFLLSASFLVSFAPALGVFLFLDVEPSMKLMITGALAVFGCCYVPMSLLAVSMYDTSFALNPLLIIPSMVRIFREYMVACLVMAVLVAIRTLCAGLLGMIPIPFIPDLIMSFIALYLFTVEMRILGMMYYCKKDELGWNF